MTSWPEWLNMQNGVNLGRLNIAEARAFIRTPRDLATYVHFDQLHQAYFNACLIVLGAGASADRGFRDTAGRPNNQPHVTPTGFATCGGPHTLSLMTEVATRALRAKPRQKFRGRPRARPQRLATLITQAANDEWTAIGDARPQTERALADLGIDGAAGGPPIRALIGWVAEVNAARNDVGAVDLRKHACAPLATDWRSAADRTCLLPIAFPEGSSMHPAYGAGHAAGAGACMTMLKAFFKLHEDAPTGGDAPAPLDFSAVAPRLMRVSGDGAPLHDAAPTAAATIVGELNKPAANITIGRQFAAFHYCTNYYDGLRMAEINAYVILQEQLFTYNDLVTFSFPSFDDDWIEMPATGGDTPRAMAPDILAKPIGGSNELTLLAPIKPGLAPVRGTLSYAARLRLHLCMLDALGRNGRETDRAGVSFRRVDGLRTLQFVRWTLIDNDHQMLLAVNFDGTKEPYVRRFVDVAGPLRNTILCNCVDFDGHSSDLGYAGFFDHARRHQTPVELFVAAAPNLSVDDGDYLIEAR